MTNLIRLNAVNARLHHRSATWFANMARQWNDKFYADHGDKLRRDAWEFLAEARRIKAGMEQERAA